MNKKVFIIRHGDVKNPNNLVYPSTVSLSSLGRLQLIKVAKAIKSEGIEIEALFVSPFKRTMQSAKILSEELFIRQVIIVDDLQDVNANNWVGKSLTDYRKIQGDIYSHPLSANQETLSHLIMRAKKSINFIIRNNNFRTVGVVSHGDTISAMDWILKTPNVIPAYIEMKNRFYLNKGQVAEYIIDNNLKIKEKTRLITIPEVQMSL